MTDFFQLLTSVTRHRSSGHRLRFELRGGEAGIRCLECKTDLIAADHRDVADVYECALQLSPGPQRLGDKA
jgi:hypothetical protein